MLVGSIDLNTDYLKEIYKDPYKIRKYAYSLIPDEFKNNQDLKDNQLYYICMNLRKLGIPDYKGVRDTIHILLKGLIIKGYTNYIIPIGDVYRYVNKFEVDYYKSKLL